MVERKKELRCLLNQRNHILEIEPCLIRDSKEETQIYEVTASPNSKLSLMKF